MSTSRIVLLLAVVLVASLANAQEETSAAEDAYVEEFSSLNWTAGPGTFDVTPRATIELPEGYDRLDESDTMRLMELYQNPSTGGEYYLGPEDGRWFAIFSYEDTGHIEDNEDIDADDLLDSFREGTKIGNEERRARGWAEMHIIGWQYEPYYDEQTNRLSWAMLAESDNQKIVNFNTRLLGRTGVISATLVADPESLDVSIDEFEALLNDFQYNSGDTYAEYREGDKLATYGLAALVTGGAAAAVAKGAGKGLFKAIGLGLLALFAALRNKIGRLFSRKEKSV